MEAAQLVVTVTVVAAAGAAGCTGPLQQVLEHREGREVGGARIAGTEKDGPIAEELTENIQLKEPKHST